MPDPDAATGVNRSPGTKAASQRAAPTRTTRYGISGMGPGSILAVLLLEMLLLLLLLVADATGWGIFAKLPANVGVLPLLVPWGGALGGVCAGLIRLSVNWHHYKLPTANLSVRSRTSAYSRKWNAWYLIRFPIGAAFGTVAALFIVFFLGTIGITSGGDIDLSDAGVATLFVVAFAVGYQQDIFAELLKRLTTILLGSATAGAPSTMLSINEELTFGTIGVGKTVQRPIVVTNEGANVAKVVPSNVAFSDDAFSVVNYTGPIPPGESRLLDIKFAPTEPKDYAAAVTITLGDDTYQAALTGTGTNEDSQ